ncbi:MAG: hypothetical protein NC395_10005 [Prevotella sp.]|nr:hypothetical protein [Prevotella sp.]
MNSPGSKRLAETVSSAASMTLFLIFSVCCLIIVSVAASAYGRISGNYDNTFNSAAAVRYITNRIRACESAEVLSESELLLRGDGYGILIYHSGGAVLERLIPEGELSGGKIPESGGGELLFGAERLFVEESGGLITVTAEDGGGSFTARCRAKNDRDGQNY